MTALNQALLFIGALTLLLGLLSGLFKSKVYVFSEPMAAVTLGILIGPAVFDVLRLESWGPHLRILEQVARLTIAVAVMSIALRLPKHYFRNHLRSMGLILTLGMVVMWLASGLLSWWLLSVPFWTALLIGAVVTPTDPVLAGTITTGTTATQNIPGRLRHALSAESGANDGGAYPFVFLCIFMLTMPAGEAWSQWGLQVILWDVLVAVIAGAVIGFIAGHIQRWSEDRGDLNETSMLTVTLALSFTVLGAVKLMGSDGILAVFAAGLAFNNVATKQEESEQQSVQETANRLLFFPIFVFFGMALPWEAWGEIGWGLLIGLAALILLLRRLPMMFVLAPGMPPLKKRADVLFNGWFGPIGVAALYYATLSTHEVGNHEIWHVASFIILSSVIAHGITATPFTKLYGSKAREHAPAEAT
jgi:NhaP-type Na+/H+ or K+/H+ antiporter